MALERDKESEKFGLPLRPFLYTLDQIADFLSVTERTLKVTYIYFDGIHTGRPPRSKIVAKNITPDTDKSTWRVHEHELVRWLRHVGFKVYDASVVRSR